VIKKDIAARAFLKYARLGLDKRNLTAMEMARHVNGVASCEREAVRLLSVYDTLRILRAEGRDEDADAVRAVYFPLRGRVPRKNDITYAVRRFAYERSLDERTVWRKIDRAKALYCSILEEQLSCL